LPYTGKVTKRLAELWGVVDEDRDKHKIKLENFEQFKSDLDSLESTFYADLKGRGNTNLKLWQRRTNRADTSWHHPFTMIDIPTNPIWG
jgi:hypothetical protein